jgi:hypothetical protein
MKSRAGVFRHVALLLICLAAPGFAAPGAAPASISIVIDDLGIGWSSGERALYLPGDVTFAILPYGRYSIALAKRAHEVGREVILHMPMENVQNRPMGEGGLNHLQDHDLFAATLTDAIEQLPHVVGISNHMGSYLTQQDEQMRWLMENLKQRGLFFIDSRTTASTLAARVARRSDVHQASRDVFLDNELTFFAIDQQFQRLLQIARRRGRAIAIGHPHETTLSYLEMVLPLLAGLQIQLVPVSRMVDRSRAPTPHTLVARGAQPGPSSAGSQ